MLYEMPLAALLIALGTPVGLLAVDCKDLPSHSDLRAAPTAARGESNGGFNLNMWGAIVDRDGIVCAVAFTGNNRGDQWPGSRVI